MSSLRGDPSSDSWTLPSTIDDLAAAARQAGRPGSIWLAGIAYQLVVLGWFSGAAVAVPVLQDSALELGQGLLGGDTVRWHWLPGLEEMVLRLHDKPQLAWIFLPLILVLFRMACGLARLSAPVRWEEARIERRGKRRRRGPRLSHAWRGGRGLTLAGVALWVQFLLMMFGATLIFIGPAQLFVRFVHLDEIGALTAILSGVLLGLLLLYSFLLSILFQIALQSLVAKQRGVGSAVLHAWRIARNDPMASLRAALADAVLIFTVTAIQLGLTVVAAVLHLPDWMLWLPLVGLLGFGGVARCAFWARVYQTLGGLSTLDPDVPGGVESEEV